MIVIHAKNGQSLIEIIISIGLFALAIGGAFLLLGNQLSNLQMIRNSITATTKAEEGLEGARLIRDRDWNELGAGAHGLAFISNTWQFQGNSDVEGGFTRTVTVSDISSNERLISSSTNWTSLFLPQTFTLTSVLTNWRNLVPLLLSGNWRNPQTIGSIDLGPGNSATSLAVRNSFVYITATASDSGKKDFYIINATDGANPVISGSVNTGEGLNSVAISGNYAYVAHDDDDNQFQIINISNPSTPSLRSQLEMPSPNDEEGLAIAVAGQYAYLGTKRSPGGPEFFVIDTTNPSNPQVVGTLEISDDINDVFVFENRVFLATSKDTQEFIIINATSPTTPVQVTAVDLPGTNENGRGLYINSQDNRAYLARTFGNNVTANHEIAIIDVTNPDIPTVLGTKNFPADVISVFAADNLAFFGTSNANEEFQIFDATNPMNMSYYAGLNFPQIATDLAFENNIIYVAVRSNDALRIITSQ